MQKMDDLKYIDRFINDSLTTMLDDPYTLPQAILFGVETFNGEVPLTVPIGTAEDIYDMLEDIELAKQLAPYTKFGVVTSGWAAPIPQDGTEYDDSVPPSKHQDKRRVRLFSMIYDGEILSSIRFQDDPDTPVYDDSQAQGSLKEAMLQMSFLVALFKGLEGCND